MSGSVPLISVCIPAYNHEKYVELAIRSVLEQDYPHIELIVVDDCSQDDTWPIIKALEKECCEALERVVLKRNEINLGTWDTFNKLCSLSIGEFFIPLASDDKLLPGALSALIKPMLDDNAIGVVVGQNLIMAGDGRICFWDKERNNVYTEEESEWRTFNDFLKSSTGIDSFRSQFGIYAALLKSNHVVNGYLIRRKSLDKVLPFTKEAPLEDWWMHLQLAKITGYKAIDIATFCYRWHNTNTVKNRDLMLRIARQTLWYEWKSLLKSGDKCYIDAFSSVYFKRKYECGIGRLLYFEHVRVLNKKWHEFHIGKWSLKFREREI